MTTACGKGESDNRVILEAPELITQESQDDKSITLSWPTVGGARSYSLYWSYDKNITQQNAVRIDNIVSPFLFEAKYGQTLYVSIVAVANDEEKASELITLNFPPLTPQGFTGSAMIGTNSLSWLAPDNVEVYILYRAKSGDDFSQAEITTLTSATSYEDTEILPLSKYSYWVTAVRQDNESILSEPVVLHSPWIVETEEQADTGIKFIWPDVYEAISYELLLSFSPELDEVQSIKIKDIISPFELTAIPGQSVYAKINAISKDENNYSELFTFDFAPSAPEDVNVALSPGINTISWQASEHTETYTVYRAVDGEDFSAAVKIGETSELFYVDENIAILSSNTYWVTAHRLNLFSTPSLPTVTRMPHFVYPLLLNDTGFTKFLSTEQTVDEKGKTIASLLAAEPVDFPGQDANTGRDVTIPDATDGSLGFSFSKLDRVSGEKLLSNVEDYGCVKDNVTGLVWENKVDFKLKDLSAYHQLHDSRARHVWYDPNPATNGGVAGQSASESMCDSRLISGDMVSFVNAVNSEALCGFSDWRVPNIEEFRSIVDYSIKDSNFMNPMLDRNYFPYAAALDHRFTSISSHQYPARAYGFHFYEGRAEAHAKSCTIENQYSYHNGLMLVRGPD